MFLLVCVQSTVRSPVTVQTYRGGSKEASMLEKTLPYLTGHICTSMAPSVQSHCMRSHSGAKPERVGQEVHRSELGDLIPGVIHRPLPHAKMVAERPCSCVNSTNVGSGPKPLPPNWTHSITFEWHTLLRNNSKHLGIWKAFCFVLFCFLWKWTNKTNDEKKYTEMKTLSWGNKWISSRS